MDTPDTHALATMTTAEKIGQLVLAGLPGPTLDADTATLFRERHLGGVILFARNIVDAAQTRTLTNAIQAATALRPAGWPALIGADQEGGRVLRTAALPEAIRWPAAMALGATDDPALTERVSAALGAELRALGINVAFAPDADVNANPLNPVIGTRSFGESPARVADFVVATLRGLASAGIAGTAKHFPGHGDTALDSHLALPTIPHDLAYLRRVDLVPFAAAIAAGVPLIMTAHIRFPALEPDGVPATLSRRILTGLLREEMGYDGVIVSDAMTMQAIRDHYGIVAGCVQSIIAGADLVIPLDGQEGAVLDALLVAVADGRLPGAQVDASVRRILRLRRSLAASPEQPEHATTPPAFGVPAHHDHDNGAALARDVARRSVTVLAAPPGTLLLTTEQGGQAGSAPAIAVAVVECLLGSASEAEQVPDAALPLLTAIRARFPEARGAMLAAESPTDTQRAAAYALAADADMLVIGTSDLARFPRQVEAVAALMQSARRVVVIAQRGPYDLGVLPPLPHVALIATYGDSPDALAAVALIAGDTAPIGRLPVTVSAAFPRGSGLGRI